MLKINTFSTEILSLRKVFFIIPHKRKVENCSFSNLNRKLVDYTHIYVENNGIQLVLISYGKKNLNAIAQKL